MLSSKYPHLQA